MKLFIGGRAQGKLHYVLQKYQIGEVFVADGSLPNGQQKETVIINHFHKWFQEGMQNGFCPEDKIAEYLNLQPDCIIISDEIFNGIVPMDCFERTYRERLGRCLTQLAGQAEEVERIICGLGQKIK